MDTGAFDRPQAFRANSNAAALKLHLETPRLIIPSNHNNALILDLELAEWKLTGKSTMD